MRFLFLLLFVSNASFAAPVTEYDKSVEEVFLAQGEPASELSKLRDPEAVRERWRNLKHAQEIRVQGTKGFAFQFKLPDGIDLEAIAQLDELATVTWNTLLKCHRYSFEARESYARGVICDEAKETFSELKNSVVMFLSSTPSQSFDYKAAFTANLTWDSADYQVSASYYDARAGMDAIAKNKYMLGTFHYPDLDEKLGVNKIIDQVSFPSLHPLFRQMLLEAAADGYPFPFGTYDCGGIRCAINLLSFRTPRRFILSTPVTWEARGFNRNDEEESRIVNSIGLMQKILSAEKLPSSTELPLGNPYLEKLRRSFAAIHLMSLASLGPQGCGEWGLWPERSFRLLNAMAATSTTLNSSFYEYNEVDRILYRISGACPYELANIMILGGATETHDMGKRSIDYLTEVGAWRKLFDRSEK